MKTLKSIAAGAAILFLSASGIAQTNQAKEILDELSEKTRKMTTITSEFDFTLIDVAADVEQTQSGMVKMKGNSYYIKLDEIEIYSDGTTRWTYSGEMNEVGIDSDDSGDEGLNPTKIYTVWETGFKHYYQHEVNIDGRPCHYIKLNPTEPAQENFHTVELYIDKGRMELRRIKILGKQGDNYIYDVKSFTADIPYSASDFVFSKADHPGVDVIDNR